MFDCDSSLIHSYGYDPDTLEFMVNFHKGGAYTYKGVTQDRFADFLRAKSKGQYFLQSIKGLYQWEKS